MSNEKTISNIKKAIKEHLDNNYKYDMLVDFELDVIDWNSLLEYINELQQENKQLKEKLDCDLQWALKYEKQVGNWNKLKEYIETTYKGCLPYEKEVVMFIINKMHEIERGNKFEK